VLVDQHAQELLDTETAYEIVVEETPAKGAIAWELANREPRPILVAVAKRLLGSGHRATIVQGLQVAGVLGTVDVLPDLSALLDSLDSVVRSQAQDVIDEILRIRRIKAETRDALPK
jgi:hypothetical protein